MKTQINSEQIAQFESELVAFVKQHLPEKYGNRTLSISIGNGDRLEFSINFGKATSSLSVALNEQ